MHDIHFAYTILYVQDVEQTLDFYQSAFGFSRKMLHESGDYGELDTGSTILSFSSISLMQTLGKSACMPTANAPSFEIAFSTGDVAGALARALEAGAVLVQGCEKQAWGQVTAYVTDLNGFLVELCSPIEAQP